MTTEIYVCLDLGNDTLKISFAHEWQGSETYGKLNVPDVLNQVAYPAAAFWDAEEGKWLFADELESGETRNFSTVIKIKEMLSLITKHEDGDIESRNRWYYKHGNYFPRFAFPVRRRIGRDFQYLVDNRLVFEVPEYTPQRVCEAFFSYMKEQITERIKEYASLRNITVKPLRKITVVHPSKLGEEYVEELCRLIRTAFGVPPIKDLTSTQALGLFAFHNRLMNENDKALLFDMGDETLSVSKVWCNKVASDSSSAKKMGILVDSPSAHLCALEIGGSNIDEAINEYLEKSIYYRETVGSPSADQRDHIFEEGLCSNQYLLMKDIKKAKMLMQIAGTGMFRDGVPISIRRETMIQRLLQTSDFADCVGTARDGGIAHEALQYIRDELQLPGNRDVTKILLAGGMVETDGLVRFIRDALVQTHPRVEVMTFENDVNDNDPFRIQFFETSTYAASVGGAIVALKDYSVDAVLSYSYGTWLYHLGDENRYRKHLVLFANRGDLLIHDQNRFSFAAEINLTQDEIFSLEGDEMFSTIINADEIAAHCYQNNVTYDGDLLIVGEKGDADRRRAEKAIDLRVIAGGSSTEIRFFHRNVRVSLSCYGEKTIYFEEGFIVDKKGVAKPFFDNLKSENHQEIVIRDLVTQKTYNVPASEIEFKLAMKSIEVTTNT